jgi:tetratricopeptide (TPR) repeat protein
MAMPTFLEEVRRRKIIRTAVAYLAGTFVLLQVADLTFEPLGFSDNAYRILIVLCAVAFPIAIFLSWLFDLRTEVASATTRKQTTLIGALVFASAIAIALFAVWQWPERTASVPQPPDSKVATIDERGQRDFVRARFHLSKTSPAQLDSAVRILENLTLRNPRFAAGHALLGLAYMYQYSTFRANDASLEEKALLASERALALDTLIPEAHVVRGRMLWTPSNGFAHEQAALEYKRALALDPRNAEAWFQLGQVYAHIGLLDRAVVAYDSSMSINPLDPRARTWRGQALLYQGNVADALDIFLAAPKTYNATMVGYQIAWAQSRLNRPAEAERTLQRYLEDFADDAGALTSMHAVLLAKQGNESRARARIREAASRRRNSIHFHHTAYNIGLAYTLLGEADSAVTWLRTAADQGMPCYILFANDPDLHALRTNAGYNILLDDLRRREARYRSVL